MLEIEVGLQIHDAKHGKGRDDEAYRQECHAHGVGSQVVSPEDQHRGQKDRYYYQECEVAVIRIDP